MTEIARNIKKEAAEKWKSEFLKIAKEQNSKLKDDKELAKELSDNGLNMLCVTWSDVSRFKNSSVGNNMTDMQFFAMSPSPVRKGSECKSLGSHHFVSFPATRSPNFTDEVQIESEGARGVKLKARDANGRLRAVTLDLFLKHIGKFIGDLGESTQWNDPVDDKAPLAVSHQFSILPLPPTGGGKIDIGIAAFGCQISLEPEDGVHAKKAFFKELPAGQRGDPEEEKRYNEVENFMWHIQIEMELPAGHKPSLGEEDIEEEETSCGWMTRGKKCRSCGSDDGFSDCDSDEEGLQLARVKLGDDLGMAQEADKKGTPVRVTKMFHSVTEDGKMTQERLHQFMQQMSFRKRKNNLVNGSLVDFTFVLCQTMQVTGKGNWHGGKVPETPASRRQTSTQCSIVCLKCNKKQSTLTGVTVTAG
eukprot:jgi/Bigna1/76093/fgenesh1_pg.39_\